MKSEEKLKIIRRALKKVKEQQENFGEMEKFTTDENWAVVAALEKQIPKEKIFYEGYVRQTGENRFAIADDSWECPNCHEEFIVDETPRDDYCRKCGQRLDRRIQDKAY